MTINKNKMKNNIFIENLQSQLPRLPSSLFPSNTQAFCSDYSILIMGIPRSLCTSYINLLFHSHLWTETSREKLFLNIHYLHFIFRYSMRHRHDKLDYTQNCTFWYLLDKDTAQNCSNTSYINNMHKTWPYTTPTRQTMHTKLHLLLNLLHKQCTQNYTFYDIH